MKNAERAADGTGRTGGGGVDGLGFGAGVGLARGLPPRWPFSLDAAAFFALRTRPIARAASESAGLCSINLPLGVTG